MKEQLKTGIIGIVFVTMLILSGCTQYSEIHEIKNYCEVDSDCICGKLGDNCVFANKEFNLEKGCEDFCKGPVQNIVMACVNDVCIQEFECIFDSDCDDGFCNENKCVY